VFAQPGQTDSTKTELVGEAYVTPTPQQAAAMKARTAAATDPSGAPEPKPSFRTVVTTATTEVRAASHRLVDQLLGALTGRPGGSGGASSPSTPTASICTRSGRRTPPRSRRRSGRTRRSTTPSPRTTRP